MKKTIAWMLVICLLVSMTGCMTRVSAENLMEDIKAKTPEKVEFSEDSTFMTDFAVRLLQNTMKDGENTLLSPEPCSILAVRSSTALRTESSSSSRADEA